MCRSLFLTQFLMSTLCAFRTFRRLLLVVSGLAVGIGLPRASAAADKAAIQKSIETGASWLAANHAQIPDGGESALAALALAKSGHSPDSKPIVATVTAINARVRDGKYQPGSHHAYMAAVDAMLLAELDPEKYSPQITAIRDWILQEQLANGGWTYSSRDMPGDTSVTQYACLGLWTAERCGAKVPADVWDRILQWHAKNQLPDGGYCYHPGVTTQYDGGNSTLNMTTAGIGSIMIAAKFAYPGRADSFKQLMGRQAEPTVEKPKSNIDEGPLVKVDLSVVPEADSQPVPQQIQFALSQTQAVVGRAVGWLTPRFVPMRPSDPTNYHRMYYVYSVERTLSLLGEDKLGGHAWYDEGSTELLKIQDPAGFWEHEAGFSNKFRDTCFALLFLSRSTGKILNRTVPEQTHGGGMLVGGKGEPTEVVAAKKEPTPLDQLLKSLQNPGSLDLEDAQNDLITQVQLGDRATLIGQKDSLVQLIEHPSGEVRRTAAWALGRTNDLSLARYLIDALEDKDLGVMIEAHAGLCWLSRRFDGFGLPVNPLDDLAEAASDEEKQTAIEGWRTRARRDWGNWYLRVRPYADRGDEFEARLRERLGEK